MFLQPVYDNYQYNHSVGYKQHLLNNSMTPDVEEKKQLAEKLIMKLSEMKNKNRNSDNDEVSKEIEEI